MELEISSHPKSDEVIITKFSTWHNSCAVMACVMNHRDLINRNLIAVIQILYQIFNLVQKVVSEIAGFVVYYGISNAVVLEIP